MSIKDVKQAIKEQWHAMIDSGCIPAMEYAIAGNDWLIVDIELPITEYRDIQTGQLIRETLEKGYISFSFDQDNKPCFFDGCITGADNFYHYPIDECSESLDHYLQEIAGNITDGYLLPNGLYCCEDE